jgi:hypothetical protein
MIEKPLKQALKIIVSIGLLVLSVIMLLGTSPTTSTSYAQEASPVAAWIFNGQLWVSDASGDAALLDDGYVLQATLSPNQGYIASIVNRGTSQADILVVIDLTTGESVLQLESETLPITTENERLGFSQLIWIDDSTIWFNTIGLFDGPPGFANRYDIYQVDLDGNLTEQFAVGAGGAMILSPDREKVAITRAGDYNNPNQLSMLQILDTRTGEGLSEVFEFSAVATGSEIMWSPSIQWHADSTRIAFAIPKPDLIYATDSLSPTQVCTLPVEGSVSCSDEQMSYPAQPVWNDDLTRIAFVRQLLNAENFNSREIIFGEYSVEGITNLVILPPDEDLPQPLLWLDDNTLLFQTTFSPPPNLYSTSFDAKSAQIWQANGQTVLNLQRLNATTFLISTGNYETIIVGIYDLEQNAFDERGTFTGGFISFVER